MVDYNEMKFADLVKEDTLWFDSTGLNNGNLDEIAKVMQKTKVLKRLYLQGNEITLAKSAKLFLQALADNRTLVHIALDWNGIDHEGAKRLAAALKANKTLVSIDLDQNQIRDDGAKSLSAALAVNKALTTVQLEENFIGDNGAKYLARALNINEGLQFVDLCYNNIGDKGAQYLASSLERNQSLQKLHLTVNKITDKGAQALAKALQNNQVIFELCLEGNRVSSDMMNKIEDLLLVKKKKIRLDRNLRDSDLGVLVEVLQKSTVLEELNLSGNRISLANGKSFTDALAKNRTLKSLSLNANEIGNEGAKRLADALKVNGTLQKIFLNKNQIDDDGAKSLAGALLVNKELQVMSLRCNIISADGVRYLASSLLANQKIHQLWVGECKYPNDKWFCIGESNSECDRGAQDLAKSPFRQLVPFVLATESDNIVNRVHEFLNEGKESKAASSKQQARKRQKKQPCDDNEIQGLDSELVQRIYNEIVHSGENVTFGDIAGLEFAKETVREMLIYPMQAPNLFTGLRAPPKGLLLFGPPGNGKTLIGRAIAHESKAKFFYISSSSLTSKWFGEGEKSVRTLYAVASHSGPSVVFIDEVDSLLAQRKADEDEAMRHIKTEFLVQLDGVRGATYRPVMTIGATNRPHELDAAALRRFVVKLYIPLPTQPSREALVHKLLAKNYHCLTDEEVKLLSQKTDSFSGADLKKLCQDAAMGPIRELKSKHGAEVIINLDAKKIPPISYHHFCKSLRRVKHSVVQADLTVFEQWNDDYGDVGCSEFEGGENSGEDEKRSVK